MALTVSKGFLSRTFSYIGPRPMSTGGRGVVRSPPALHLKVHEYASSGLFCAIASTKCGVMAETPMGASGSAQPAWRAPQSPTTLIDSVQSTCIWHGARVLRFSATKMAPMPVGSAYTVASPRWAGEPCILQ